METEAQLTEDEADRGEDFFPWDAGQGLGTVKACEIVIRILVFVLFILLACPLMLIFVQISKMLGDGQYMTR